MTELAERVAAWMHRVQAGAWQTLEAELDRFEDALTEDDREAGSSALRRVRAELACRDHGPISDLLRAAASTDDDVDRRRYTLEAARRLASVHGRPLVEELLAEAADPHMSRAFAAGTTVDPERLRAEIFDALDAGDRARAAAAAERWQGAPAFVVLASLAGEAGEWAQAAACRERAIEAEPEADDALPDRVRAGLAWWAAGDAEAARRQFSILRDATRELDDGRARYLQREATAMLEALDGASEDRPAWIRVGAPQDRPLACGGGRGLLGLLGWARPELAALPAPPRRSDPDDHPTAAHVRRALAAAGIVHARRRFDERNLEAALRREAFVVLEEERPTDTGFVWVRALDPVAHVLEVIDPARSGPLLRRFDDQRDRGALFAMSGLVVWGRGEAGHSRRAAAESEEPGLAHDPALDLLDACDLDEDGIEPPRAKVEALAAAALEAHADLPMLHRRRGEALLAKLSSGDIEAGPRGAFESWLAETRERFPDAEWPFQLYARALELQGRMIEACIAWKDAELRDPYDYRNALGRARAFAREGGLGAAHRALRKASALAPGVGEIEGMLALNALQRSDREQLRVHARIARALAPDDMRAIVASATAAELDRDFEGAQRLLETLTARDDAGSWAPARLLRRHGEAARWQEARRLAAATCARFPAEASVWAQAAAVALADGDVADSFALACTGIDRCGGSDELIDVALDGALFQAAPPGHRESIVVLVERLLPQPARVDGVVRRLVELGDEALAIDVARRAAAAFGRDLDGPWLLARSLLRTKATRSQHLPEAAELLDQLIAGSGSFPYPRVFLAIEALARGEAERALAVLEPADVPRSPVLIWELTARALDVLGRSPAAEALRARLPEGYPAAVTGEVSFLCTYGHARLAADLLEAMLAHRGREPDPLLELARCRAAMGEHAEAFALVDEAEQGKARIDPLELVAIAERIRRWDVVERVATGVVAELEVDSGDAREIWIWRAVAAGAAAAQGDAGPRARFREAAPRHVRAWRRLLRIERAAGLAELAADLEHVHSFAPGAAAWLEEGGT